MSEDQSIAEGVARVRARVAAACARSARDAREVQLVGVSKTVTVERIREAVAAGIGSLGENRIQEAEAKVPLLPDAEWHLVGHLQSNKAARALALFDVIQSIDSLALAQRLDRLLGEGAVPGRTGRYPVYLQVNVDDDPAKEGFGVDELAAALPAFAGLPRLDLRGIMTVGRLVDRAEDARPTFRRLAQLSARLRRDSGDLGPGLSMGMTDDFGVAVEEGATLIRVGRAIFGERSHDHGHVHSHEHPHP
jgi:pyridoxal phosphate enzyme (YggS family)